MADLRETSLDHVAGEQKITYYTGERKYLTKLKKQIEQYPDDVVVRHVNEDGSMLVDLPASWFKAPSPPRKVNLSDEQREKLGQKIRETMGFRTNKG